MRLLIVVSLVVAFLSFMAGAKDAAKKHKQSMTKTETSATNDVSKKDVPCDSKEDILKKLEEEKKAKEAGEKPKGFSLQGGNTGCSVK